MPDVQYENRLRGRLYHYTDFAGLKGIYEEGEIWATNSQYLNDISEMQLGPKAIIGALFRKIIPDQQDVSRLKKDTEELQAIQSTMAKEEFKRALESEDSAAAVAFRRLAEVIHKFAEHWKDFTPELLDEIAAACVVALADTTCFIFSLSKEKDQLSQWRAYARDGVCIEFSAKALRDNLASAPALRARMQSVIYHHEDKIPPAAFSNPLISWANARRAQLITDGIDLDARKATIGQEMMTQVAFVKDIHFKEEKEVRIAAQGDPNHFTSNRYGMVPRMKIPITSDAIRSVIVGPSAHAELRVKSLRKYFDHQGFKKDSNNASPHIGVDKSSIPYRDW